MNVVRLLMAFLVIGLLSASSAFGQDDSIWGSGGFWGPGGFWSIEEVKSSDEKPYDDNGGSDSMGDWVSLEHPDIPGPNPNIFWIVYPYSNSGRTTSLEIPKGLYAKELIIPDKTGKLILYERYADGTVDEYDPGWNVRSGHAYRTWFYAGSLGKHTVWYEVGSGVNCKSNYINYTVVAHVDAGFEEVYGEETTDGEEWSEDEKFYSCCREFDGEEDWSSLEHPGIPGTNPNVLWIVYPYGNSEPTTSLEILKGACAKELMRPDKTGKLILYEEYDDGTIDEYDPGWMVRSGHTYRTWFYADSLGKHTVWYKVGSEENSESNKINYTVVAHEWVGSEMPDEEEWTYDDGFSSEFEPPCGEVSGDTLAHPGEHSRNMNILWIVNPTTGNNTTRLVAEKGCYATEWIIPNPNINNVKVLEIYERYPDGHTYKYIPEWGLDIGTGHSYNASFYADTVGIHTVWYEVWYVGGTSKGGGTRHVSQVSNEIKYKVIFKPLEINVFNVDADMGETAILVVDASGGCDSGRYTYQWYRGMSSNKAMIINGETDSMLYFRGVGLDAAGNYTCKVMCPGGAEAEDWCHLNVTPPESLNIAVDNVDADMGETAILVADASGGCDPVFYTYQWYRGMSSNKAMIINGETDSMLYFRGVGLDATGNYTCKVMCPSGAEDEDWCHLNVMPPDPLNIAVDDVTAGINEMAILVADASGGCDPVFYTYQWYSGKSSKDSWIIEGETNSMLYFRGVGLDAAGDYTCKVTCPGGAEDEDWCHLTIVP
ncbi:MAG: hypothetical protein D4Q77_02805 [Methanothrix sp.]|nr:MAG: hypothetical protein D4Q77_02805 [Methanothrix sp.]